MKYIVICVLCLFSFGCTDSYLSSVSSFGSEHTVIMYSGGKEVSRWISSGKVTNEDGTYFAFRDKKTGMYVRVVGDIVVIQND